MNTVQQVTARLEELLTDPHWVTRSRGVGPLTAEVISHYGVSGPAARASGVRLDLRLQQPYLAYGDFAPLLTVPSPPAAGDAWTRLALMVHETQVSVTLVRAAVEQLRTAPGPVSVRLPKIVRLPEGETYLATEAPLGTAGVYLVSRGEKVPWRLRLRTPSFSNVAALESMLIGVAVAELETTLASMSYVVGDIDR
jgi:NADH-quinone oxidoreductase subunit D